MCRIVEFNNRTMLYALGRFVNEHGLQDLFYIHKNVEGMPFFNL